MRPIGHVLLTGVLAGTAAGAAEVRTREIREPGPDADVELKLQGGLLTYPGAVGDVTAPGPAYGVLAATDLIGAVDGELSYQGATYGLDSRLGQDGTLMENGGQALVMLSPALGPVEPYLFTGLNVTQLTVLGDAANSPLARDATLLRLPVGLGIDWVPAGDGGGEVDFLVGARVKYDVALAGDAFPTVEEGLSASPLQTTLQLGASF